MIDFTEINMKVVTFLPKICTVLTIISTTMGYLNMVEPTTDMDKLKSIITKSLLFPCIRRDISSALIQTDQIAQCLAENPLKQSFLSENEFCRSGQELIDCIKTALSTCDLKVQEIMESVVYGDLQGVCKERLIVQKLEHLARSMDTLETGGGKHKRTFFRETDNKAESHSKRTEYGSNLQNIEALAHSVENLETAEDRNKRTFFREAENEAQGHSKRSKYGSDLQNLETLTNIMDNFEMPDRSNKRNLFREAEKAAQSLSKRSKYDSNLQKLKALALGVDNLGTPEAINKEKFFREEKEAQNHLKRSHYGSNLDKVGMELSKRAQYNAEDIEALQERDKRFGFERKVTRALDKLDQKLDYVAAMLTGNMAILKEIKEGRK